MRNTSGAVVGTGTVAIGGTYAVTLTTPQVAGETLNVGLRDAAGNPSGTVAIIAPFDISAFDNVATAQVDLVPVQTNQNLGGANYLALVSLGAVNLDAQVLAIPNVQFTVQQGHRLNATFTYDATLSLGVASGYSVVVQRFNGTNWVAVNGGGSSSLLNVSLLGGDLVASADLAPGQYRAFVTFDNTAGVGLLGGLRVTGVDSDFTDVGQIVPATTNGNVITDPGPTARSMWSARRPVSRSVTLNGVTTAGRHQQPGHRTVGHADHQQRRPVQLHPQCRRRRARQDRPLHLHAARCQRRRAGKRGADHHHRQPGHHRRTDRGQRRGDRRCDLRQRGGNPRPAIDSSFETPTAALLTGSRTGQITDSFTVDANSRGNITLSAVIAPGLAVVPSFTITVTNAAGTVVGSQSGTALAGVGGLVGSGISVTMNNLPSGTYNYTVTSTNTVGLRYNTDVYVGGTITHLDQFALSGTTPVSGNLLANDTLGSDFLGIKMLVGGEFVDVGDAGRTLTGTYGTLTISEIGNIPISPSPTWVMPRPTRSTASPISWCSPTGRCRRHGSTWRSTSTTGSRPSSRDADRVRAGGSGAGPQRCRADDAGVPAGRGAAVPRSRRCAYRPVADGGARRYRGCAVPLPRRTEPGGRAVGRPNLSTPRPMFRRYQPLPIPRQKHPRHSIRWAI